MKKISIHGTVGVPAAYGGFETLAENLVVYANVQHLPVELTVYCSGASPSIIYKGAKLHFINLKANGISSIAYDIFSLFLAMKKKDDVILLLGVSGAIMLPMVRMLSNARIVTNVDGIEWARQKWSLLPKLFLKFSEYVAVKFSHEIIADNRGIAEHLDERYGCKSKVIAYGGDHAVVPEPEHEKIPLPEQYALALCRVEPENNVQMVLEAMANLPEQNLVFVGNWQANDFSKAMYSQFVHCDNIYLLDPIYDVSFLCTVRKNADIYIHGHSAGGTNPSLVEMMHFAKPILTFDCKFNRYTTLDSALYFKTSTELRETIANISDQVRCEVGRDMGEIARKNYCWNIIGEQYFDLLLVR